VAQGNDNRLARFAQFLGRAGFFIAQLKASGRNLTATLVGSTGQFILAEICFSDGEHLTTYDATGLNCEDQHKLQILANIIKHLSQRLPNDWGDEELFVNQDLRVVLTMTQELASNWVPVLQLIDFLDVSRRHDQPLTLYWPDPNKSQTPLIPLSKITKFPPLVRKLMGDRILVNSRLGEPLCVFTRVLETALLKPDTYKKSTHNDMVFGPLCQSCALGNICSGMTKAAASEFGWEGMIPFSIPNWADPAQTKPAEANWDLKLWWLLADRPDASIRLEKVLPITTTIACHYPWTRLEIHEGGSFGPCCADYLVAPGPRGSTRTADTLWQSPFMASVREAMASGAHLQTCRQSCPVLVGKTAQLQNLVIRGGSPEIVSTWIKRIKSILKGDPKPIQPPATLCFSASSRCNYNCIMCDCGERGTLDDQPDPAFYDQITSWASSGIELEVNGGEPLASPRFVKFLDDLANQQNPKPIVGLITNGSLLTPKNFSKWAPILRGVVVSVNAATSETYKAVNNGAPMELIKKNLAHMAKLRSNGQYQGGLAYSMVLLKANLHELPAFIDWTLDDQVDARVLLPIGNRNNQSILTDPELMAKAISMLNAAAILLSGSLDERQAKQIQALSDILADRLNKGIVEPL